MCVPVRAASYMGYVTTHRLCKQLFTREVLEWARSDVFTREDLELARSDVFTREDLELARSGV